ncbi:ATP-binding protein [Streptomyces sp. NPDC059070]|uniref:ATP-binding protein n=1 Tax=Streptomyces sp. NPDC059070 TaxID=3346713 RepID=UPI00367C974A
MADDGETGHVARRMVAETLQDWRLPHLVEDVSLCASELVGNAVRHATPDGWSPGTGCERRVGVGFRLWPRWLFVEVSDEDSTPPMLPVGEPLELSVAGASPEVLLPNSGRGLFIVQNIADATWWAPRELGGKSVFCRFSSGGTTP